MDLGISGRTALLCGASKGLGRACAERLAQAGVHVVLTARTEAQLSDACRAIREAHGVQARYIVADMSEARGRAAIIAGCPDPDMLILGGGWPDISVPPAQWTAAMWHGALEALMITQIELMAAVTPGMVARRFGRIVAITSRLIKEPEYFLAMPNAARHGLTAYMKSLSREVARHNVTVNTMLPGIFETERQVAHTEALVQAKATTTGAIIEERTSLTPAGRFGKPREFSALCAYLCSEDASFLTGQALVIDGGAHAGVW